MCSRSCIYQEDKFQTAGTEASVVIRLCSRSQALETLENALQLEFSHKKNSPKLKAIGVEAVILREYREKDIMQKSLMRNQTAAGHSGGEAAVKKKPFTPDTTRCCSMGRKVAKRRLSCEVKVLDFLHHFNSARQRYNRPQDIKPSKMSFKMSSKVKKCTSSPNLSRHFKKCCVYQKQYFRNMKKCKKQPPEERRRCRKSIRERYS